MHSLRDLAQRALRDVEHQLEQDLERVERPPAVFQPESAKDTPVEHCFSRKTAKNELCSTVPAPIAWNAGTLADLAGRIERMPCPSRINPKAWRAVVLDCRRVIADGWAVQAHGLGWSELDLFGAVPDPEGDADADGLAVKLNGRRVLAICASFATVADANGGRSYLYRGNNEGARLLWKLGRGR